MRYLITVILLALAIPSFCQDKFVKPDYKKIEKEVQDKKSKFYYPTLLERYQKDDSSISVEEYSYLYYGYFFNKSYSSFETGDEKINEEIRTLERKQGNDDDMRRLITLYQQRLAKGNPFSIETLVSLYGAHNLLKDATGQRRYDLKLQGITSAIMKTGDGRSEETAMHILSVPDEYAMVSILGYESTGSQSLTQKTCDYLEIGKNDDGLKGLYFDVNQIFEGYKTMFK